MLDKIKDFIDEVKDTIEWIANGCPQPQPIPIKDDKNEKDKKRRT